ncbi:MAG: glycogen debranching protein GlgX [Thermoleophilia bacterium]
MAAPERTSDALGAHVRDGRAHFAVTSHHADSVDLVLPNDGGERHVPLTRGDDGVWRAAVPALRHGQRYGYRVAGPHDPSRGLLFDSSRRMHDPYARAFDGAWSVLVDLPLEDTGPHPRTPLVDSVIYETHVRGLTRLHPGVPPDLRGTYAGLAHPAVIAELTALGVTAVQLMPVHEHRTEAAIAARGLTNYWGYSTLGFFAPHGTYAASGTRGGQVSEFRAMVRALHAAGLEVILDVVFNHTCEGGPDVPPVCFRGIDNPSWYWLAPDDPAHYYDTTGCGNTLDPESPVVRRMVLDSLRYWVTEMGVDGFRFDLAVSLARRRTGFDPQHPLLTAMAEDPALAGTKLIAEPWDLGPGGYQVGRFPPPFADHNGIFRDEVRELWCGRGTMGMLAGRLAGGEDAYGASGRGPAGAVNLITAHDGFTLADLVSYDHKHNEANLEGNLDGESHNRSWNSGAEGPTNDPGILELRDRRARGLLATLFMAVGVPMVVAGDERLRTQGGNNNAYCQDNPVSWMDWTLDERREAFLAFARRVVALRAGEPLLRRDAFLRPRDVAWLHPDGTEMNGDGWNDHGSRALGMLLRGRGVRPARPDLLVLVNAGPARVPFTLPDAVFTELLDTARPDGAPGSTAPVAGTVELGAWSVRVLRRRRATRSR